MVAEPIKANEVSGVWSEGTTKARSGRNPEDLTGRERDRQLEDSGFAPANRSPPAAGASCGSARVV